MSSNDHGGGLGYISTESSRSSCVPQLPFTVFLILAVNTPFVTLPFSKDSNRSDCTLCDHSLRGLLPEDVKVLTTALYVQMSKLMHRGPGLNLQKWTLIVDATIFCLLTEALQC